MAKTNLDFESLAQSARELLDAIVSLEQSYQTLVGLDVETLQPEALRIRDEQLQQMARMHEAISKGLKLLFTSTAQVPDAEESGLDCCVCGHVRGQHSTPGSGGPTLRCLTPGCLCQGFTLSAEEIAPRA